MYVSQSRAATSLAAALDMPRIVTVLDGGGGVALSLTYGAAAPVALRTLQQLIGSVARYTRQGGYELNLLRSADCRVVFRRCVAWLPGSP